MTSIADLPPEILSNCLSFLGNDDLYSSRLVKKGWRSLVDDTKDQNLWKQISIRDGVPLVVGDTNYKENFLFLKPITISGRIIGEYLGSVVGALPRISKADFSRLKDDSDPFETDQKMKESFVILVDPAALSITVGPERPLELDASGTLIEDPFATRRKLPSVPLSLYNLKMLTKYPLGPKKEWPIFNPIPRIGDFEYCNAPLEQTGIHIMRKNVVEPGLSFEEQKILVTNTNLKIMKLRERALFNSIEILRKNFCPDSTQGLLANTYARCSDLGDPWGPYYFPAIGGNSEFYPGRYDLSLHHFNGDPFSMVGAPVGFTEN